MTNPTESNSFFKQLIKRRVLPIIGIYLGATVALMEFSGMVIERYGFNDRIVDYVLAIMLTFIPGMLILAWRHGAPGKDEWGKIEKIGVPANLLAVVAVIFFLNIQSHSSGEQTLNAQTIEQPLRQAAAENRSAIPRLGILFFDQEVVNPEQEWESYAATFLLTSQLRQNSGMHTTSLFDNDFYWEIRRAGYRDGKNLPFSLARRVARNNDLHYFLHGQLSKSDNYQLELKVYDTKTAREIKQLSVTGDSLFAITDSATQLIQAIPELKLDQASALNQIPAKEFATANEDALKAFIESMLATTFDNDYVTASERIERAIELDPNFALAYMRAGTLAVDQGLLEKSNRYFKKALQYNYKLTPRLRLTIRAAIYATEQNSQEQINLYRNWIELYPNDYEPKNQLAFVLKFRSEDRSEIIQLLNDSLALNPAQPEVYGNLAEAYLAQQDIEAAKKAYQQQRELRPESFRPLLQLGYIALDEGKLDEADKLFAQASLVESDKVSPVIESAMLAFRQGDLETTRRKLDEAAMISQAPRQLAMLKQAKMNVATLSGQPEQAYQLLQEFQQTLSEFENPIESLFGAYVSQTEIYIAANKQEVIEQQLEEFKQGFDPSIRPLIDFATLFIEIHNQELDKAKATHLQLIEVVDTFQLTQLRYLLHFTTGRIAEEEQRWSDALAALDRTEQNIRLYPNFNRHMIPIIEHMKIRVLRKSGAIDDAITTAESYLKKWPFHPAINLEYAKVLLADDRTEEAKQALEKVTTILQSAESQCRLCRELDRINSQIKNG